MEENEIELVITTLYIYEVSGPIVLLERLIDEDVVVNKSVPIIVFIMVYSIVLTVGTKSLRPLGPNLPRYVATTFEETHDLIAENEVVS